MIAEVYDTYDAFAEIRQRLRVLEWAVGRTR